MSKAYWENDTTNQRELLLGVATILSLAFIGIALADTLMILGTKTALFSSIKMHFITKGNFLFLIAFPLPFLLGARLGFKEIVIASCAAVLSWMSFANFRGSWVWSGFFDRYESPSTPIVVPALAGAAIGLVVGLILARMVKSTRAASSTVTMIAVSCLCVCAIWTYIEPRIFPIDSVFAPSRFIPTSVAAIVAVGCLWRSSSE